MREKAVNFPAGLSASADQRTGFLLQWAHQRSRRAFNQALRALKIEARHLGVLSLLADRPGLNQKQLVEQLELDKSAVVLILDDLERLGLAARFPHPRDRRAHTLQITGKGRKHLGAANRISVPLGRAIFAGLTREERKTLDRALLRIISNCQTQES